MRGEPDPSQRGRLRGSQTSRGASLVEFALILPVFAMLLFGGITAGFALNEKQQVTHAVREGARYAATIPPTQTFSSGTWASNVRDLIVARSSGSLTASDVCVSLVEGSPGTVVSPPATYSTSSSACISGQTFPVTATDDGLRVQVTATKDAEIDFVVSSLEVTMESDATARSESG